jgi:hypothetical protein
MTDTNRVDNRRRQEAIEAMRKQALALPEGYRFNRDEIYDERFDSTVLGRALKEAALKPVALGGDISDLNESEEG